MSRRAPVDVLHLVGSARPEATSIVTIVRSIAELIDPGRFRVTVWFLAEDGPLRAALAEAGIEARHVPFGGKRDLAGVVRLRRELARQKFGIIHRHTGGRSLGLLLRTATSARLVTHVHGFREDGAPLPNRFAMPLTDHIITTSSWLATIAARVPVTVVHPGVDVATIAPARPPADEAPLVIGAAGRLVPMKGLRHLVAALPIVRQELADVCIEIAGDGPERPALEGDVRRLGLGDSVRLLGWRTPPVISCRWTVFAQPSVVEPFGMTALEAMAAGLPVVASDVGGLRDLVVDGVTGCLVPAADPDALARAIVALLRSPQRRSELGTAGRNRAAEQFNRARMVADVTRIYDRLLSEKR